MNIKEIKELLNLMNENNLSELEVEKEGMRVKLRKGTGGGGELSGPIIVERERTAAVQGTTPAAAAAASAPAAEASKLIPIKAPMVGTFYRAPSPEAAPFVNVGDTVEPGQVVCIIEAMKLMNEIKSDIRGKVKEVLIDNAEPLEFGQTIFMIEPNG